MGLTERLARACAAHPRLTLACWGAAVLIALVLVATSLHGLSSSSHVVGSPESTKAENAVARAFPHQNPNGKGDVVVVASSRYAVELASVPDVRQAPRRRPPGHGGSVRDSQGGRFVRRPRGARLGRHQERLRRGAGRAGRGAGERRGLPGRHHGGSHREPRLRQAVAEGPRDGRARVRLAGGADRPRARLRSRGRRDRAGADGDPLDHRRARPRGARLSRVHALGVHREHAHGDGARARNRLFAVHRLALSRGAGARLAQGRRDRASRCDGEPRGAVQRQHVRDRAARHVHRPDLDHAEPRARRDPRRHRLGRRRADPAPRVPQPPRGSRELVPGAVPRAKPWPHRFGGGSVLAPHRDPGFAEAGALARGLRRLHAAPHRADLRPPHRRERRQHAALQPAFAPGPGPPRAFLPRREPGARRDRGRRRQPVPGSQRSRAARQEARGGRQVRAGEDPAVFAREHAAAHVAAGRRRRRRPGHRRGTRPARERDPVDLRAAAGRMSTSAGRPPRTSTTSTR